MAHVNMQLPNDSGYLRAVLDNYAKRRNLERELNTREKIASQQIGAQLQTNRATLDAQLEMEKLRQRTNELIAKYRGGVDLQLKQMGIDLETTLQKMRNFNAVEIAEFNAKAAQILENLKDEHVQSQILKTYQKELNLANYDAKTALYRTYLSVVGDVYKTGNPLDNAADAAAFGLFAIAMRRLYGNGIDIPDNLKIGNLDQKVEISKEESNAEVNELIKVLKGEEQSEHVAPGSKITKWAEPKLKTKVKMFENQRAGKTGRKNW